MRLGRRIAVDVGKARVGLAVCDVHGILASGLATVARATEPSDTIAAVFRAIDENGLEIVDIIEIYVGLPTNLKGLDTESTRDAILVAQELARQTSVEVRMVDERLSTVSASAALRSSGINSKKGRSVIDQVAATIILEQAIALEKSSGKQPGTPIAEFVGEL